MPESHVSSYGQVDRIWLFWSRASADKGKSGERQKGMERLWVDRLDEPRCMILLNRYGPCMHFCWGLCPAAQCYSRMEGMMNIFSLSSAVCKCSYAFTSQVIYLFLLLCYLSANIWCEMSHTQTCRERTLSLLMSFLRVFRQDGNWKPGFSSK